MPMTAFASATALAIGSPASSDSSSLIDATFCAIVRSPIDRALGSDLVGVVGGGVDEPARPAGRSAAVLPPPPLSRRDTAGDSAPATLMVPNDSLSLEVADGTAAGRGKKDEPKKCVTAVKVRFDGWGKKWDEWVLLGRGRVCRPIGGDYQWQYKGDPEDAGAGGDADAGGGAALGSGAAFAG